MRTRSNGEARERLRELLTRHARRFGLTQAAVDTLVRTAVLERWASGDEIVSQEDAHDLVTFVVVGSARVVCPTPHGGAVTVCFGAPGQFVATGWLFDGPPVRREFRVIAHDAIHTVVAAWSQAVVLDVMASLPVRAQLQLTSCGWRAFSSLLREKCHLLGLPLRDRVLAALQALARDFGASHPAGRCIGLRVTHADVAGMAAGSRANVTRAIDALRTQGMVATERHRFVVTHRGLAALHDPPPPRAACG
jgi:CRP-like cAMP-binding protein